MSHCTSFSMQQPVQTSDSSARLVVGLIRGGVALMLIASFAAFVVRGM